MVTPGENILDSRDIITSLAELNKKRQQALLVDETTSVLGSDSAEYRDKLLALDEEKAAYWVSEQGNVFSEHVDWCEDDEQQYQDLNSLREQCSNFAGLENGIPLVLDSHMEEYAQNTATDLGFISSMDQWPATCIDWDKAVEELKQDYRVVEYGGYSYFCRYI